MRIGCQLSDRGLTIDVVVVQVIDWNYDMPVVVMSIRVVCVVFDFGLKFLRPESNSAEHSLLKMQFE